MTAAAEHKVRSPMVEAEMDKAQVREAARWLAFALGQAGATLPVVPHPVWHAGHH